MADATIKLDAESVVTLKNGSRITIDGTADGNQRVMADLAPLAIKRVKSVDPIATHIKEVNHIDPISIESLQVTGVRDIEPVHIEELNVTNIPTMNHTVRQVPPLDMNVRRVPPLSIGLNQRFSMPSDYTVRASILGVEVARLHIQGETHIIPLERNKPEQHHDRSKSYPVIASGGNPGIPVLQKERTTVFEVVDKHCLCQDAAHRGHEMPHTLDHRPAAMLPMPDRPEGTRTMRVSQEPDIVRNHPLCNEIDSSSVNSGGV